MGYFALPKDTSQLPTGKQRLRVLPHLLCAVDASLLPGRDDAQNSSKVASAVVCLGLCPAGVNALDLVRGSPTTAEHSQGFFASLLDLVELCEGLASDNLLTSSSSAAQRLHSELTSDGALMDSIARNQARILSDDCKLFERKTTAAAGPGSVSSLAELEARALSL